MDVLLGAVTIAETVDTLNTAREAINAFLDKLDQMPDDPIHQRPINWADLQCVEIVNGISSDGCQTIDIFIEEADFTASQDFARLLKPTSKELFPGDDRRYRVICNW